MTTNKKGSAESLRGLLPFLRPYRWQMGAAVLFLLLAAAATLAFPVGLRFMMDKALAANAQSSDAFFSFMTLFAMACALAVFSSARYFSVTWLGERITADIRVRVYSHVLLQGPDFFETTHSGEVLSRLSNDVTLD